MAATYREIQEYIEGGDDIREACCRHEKEKLRVEVEQLKAERAAVVDALENHGQNDGSSLTAQINSIAGERDDLRAEVERLTNLCKSHDICFATDIQAAAIMAAFNTEFGGGE